MKSIANQIREEWQKMLALMSQKPVRRKFETIRSKMVRLHHARDKPIQLVLE